jgi:hypothetical protein
MRNWIWAIGTRSAHHGDEMAKVKKQKVEKQNNDELEDCFWGRSIG